MHFNLLLELVNEVLHFSAALPVLLQFEFALAYLSVALIELLDHLLVLLLLLVQLVLFAANQLLQLIDGALAESMGLIFGLLQASLQFLVN